MRPADARLRVHLALLMLAFPCLELCVLGVKVYQPCGSDQMASFVYINP